MAAMARRWQAEKYGGPENLRLISSPVEPPQESEVLVRPRAVEVNFTDLIIIMGAASYLFMFFLYMGGPALLPM